VSLINTDTALDALSLINIRKEKQGGNQLKYDGEAGGKFVESRLARANR